jgi:hypothetical protein
MRHFLESARNPALGDHVSHMLALEHGTSTCEGRQGIGGGWPMSAVTGKRRGRGKAKKSLELINAAVDIMQEIQPAPVRAVCYRLFVAEMIDSMVKSEVDKVGRQLVYAREEGIIPWSWIVDETREAERIASWDHPDELIAAAIRQYRKDYWSGQPNWVEVWSEKGTVRGVLEPVLRKYGVTFRVMHGYGSATSIQSVAAETIRNHKPLTILYVGDWDPSGLHMSMKDIPNRLGRYGGDADIFRIALTEADIGPDLPSFPAATKKKDPRYQWFSEQFGPRCWELDAMSPVILRNRVEAHIRDLIDMDLWNRAIEVERAERISMESFFESWGSISMQAGKYPGGDV